MVNAVPFMGVLFSIYFFLTMFTVLNMLIGVLCEVVSAVSEVRTSFHTDRQTVDSDLMHSAEA